jgi:Bacterial Ig-like domain (group 3)/FG-GAP-like repeat
MTRLRLLVVCAITLASISIHAGNRTLQTAARIDAGSEQSLGFIAAGDFTSDGKPDVLVADFNAGSTTAETLRVAAGLGDGTFAPAIVTPVAGFRPRGVADFNGDGDLDVYVTGFTTFGVMLGDGNGSFATPVTTSSPVMNAITAGDFTGDGHIDVALVADNTDSIFLFAGNGAGGFGPQQTHSMAMLGVKDAVAGDFDGDGKLDLAVLGGGTLAIGWNSGTSFTLERLASNVMQGLAAGDVNGDGITDAVVSNDGRSLMFFGSAARGLTAVQLPSAFQAASTTTIAVARIDGDARADIIGGGAALTVLTHDGAAFRTPRSYKIGDYPGRPVAADFDADGRMDLAGLPSSVGPGYFWVVRGKGDGTLHADVTFPLGGVMEQAGRLGTARYIADLDGDGNNDLVTTTYVESGVAVLFGNGDGTFAAPVVTELPPTSHAGVFRASDLNGDGRVDLILWDSSDPSQTRFWTLFSRTDGTFDIGPLRTSDKAFGNLTGLVPIHDFTGDGHLDLFEESGLLHPGLGNGTFGTPIATGVDIWSGGKAVADVNGDSKPDLLSVVGNELSAYLNTGGGTFAAPVKTPWYSSAMSFADVNGDGFADVTSELAFGAGDGTFTYGFYVEPGPSVAGDFDGDGNTDLAGMTAVYFGTGDGAFDYASRTAAYGRVASTDDFNGDGVDDLWVFDGPWLTISHTVPNEANIDSEIALSATVNPVPMGGFAELIARPVPSTTTRAAGAVLFSKPPAAAFGMALVEDDGTVTWGFPPPPLGDSVTYAATFTGDAHVLPSSAPSLTVTSTKGTTITSLTTSRSSYLLGTHVVITALVRTGRSEPPITGTIRIRRNGVDFRTIEAPTGTIGINDPAVFPIGTYTLQADYPGDYNYLPSSSSTVTIQIVKARPDLFLANPPQPLTSQQLVSLTASFPNHPNATGSVAFHCLGQTLGSAPVAAGQAILQTRLPAGQGICSASYSGDAAHESTSDFSDSITVDTAAFPTPPAVDVTAITGQGFVRIFPIAGAVSYDVYRSVDGGPLTFQSNTTGTSYQQTVPASVKVVVYAVSARNADGNTTAIGPRDYASLATFTDAAILYGSTTAKTAHFLELQAAIRALRIAAGLPGGTFPLPTGVISGSQITSLRNAVAEARSAFGLATYFTDPTLTPQVTRIRGIHVEQLRNALR